MVSPTWKIKKKNYVRIHRKMIAICNTGNLKAVNNSSDRIEKTNLEITIPALVLKSHGKGRQLYSRMHRRERRYTPRLGKSPLGEEICLQVQDGRTPPPSPHTHPRCSQECRVCERLGHAPTHSLTFFLSLLNFFCRASSSSLSPGGITNMVAPGSGAGPKTSFSTVTAQGSHTVHTAPNRTPPGLPTPVFCLSLSLA